jgi:isopentenyldiphosphate isomerase
VDTLSRIDVDGFIQKIITETKIREKVIMAQKKDSELGKEIERNPKYEMIDRILYWKHKKKNTGEKESKLIILKRMKRLLMEKNHDLLMGGRLELKRTYVRLI